MKLSFHQGRIMLESEGEFRSLTMFGSAELLNQLLNAYAGKDVDEYQHRMLRAFWNEAGVS